MTANRMIFLLMHLFGLNTSKPEKYKNVLLFDLLNPKRLNFIK